MIGALSGKVESIVGSELLLDVHGVYYEVLVSANVATAALAGAELKLLVYTDVRENAIVLYGFSSPLEKQAFLLCKKVKGIGSKIALGMISSLGAEGLLLAVGQSDHQALQTIPGVGKKTAERIIVELREQVASFAVELSSETAALVPRDGAVYSRKSATGHLDDLSTVSGDAVLALEKLGVSADKARRAVEHVAGGCSHVSNAGELLKLALAHL